MKNLYQILILLFISISTFGQRNDLAQSQLVRNNISELSNQLDFVRTVPLPPAEDIGTVFLFEDYKNSEVYVNTISDTVYFDSLNYNLELTSLVYILDKTLYMIPTYSVKYFKVDDKMYLNKNFLADKMDQKLNPVGFIEEIYSSDNLDMYLDYDLEIIPPSYNAALDVGNRSRQLKQDRSYHMIYKGEWITDFKPKSKSVKKYFKANSKEIMSFIDENNLTASGTDMKVLAEYISGLN